MHECASAESWPAAVSRAWRLQGQIDRALAWSDSQHGVRPASHRGLTLNSAQKGAKASRLNCRSAAVPHESDGARELRMALSGCVNRSSEPAASRKRSFRLPQTHRAKRRGQPANPERRRYLRAESFSGSQFLVLSGGHRKASFPPKGCKQKFQPAYLCFVSFLAANFVYKPLLRHTHPHEPRWTTSWPGRADGTLISPPFKEVIRCRLPRSANRRS